MESIMTYAQSFFGWLLQATLIASVVICLILLIQKILGGRLGPRWCHALWLVLLIRMILPWAPSSRLSLLNLIPSWDRQTQSQQLPEIAEQKEVSPLAETAENPEAIPDQGPQSEATIRKVVAPKPSMIANAKSESRLRLLSIRPILPVLWLAGTIVIGAYLLMSNFALWRIIKRDRPLVKQATLELFEECKAQMGVQSLVVVVPSNQIKSPALFGFIRPRLLLPLEMLEKASREEMRYVFLHELAHLRRHDIYVGWLTSLLQVLHWFNPLIWFAFYRMRSDRELACDALVLARTQKEESQEYGQAIVSLVRRFSRSRRLPAMAGILESKSQLKRRIAMITQFKKNSYQWSPLAVILIVTLACVSLPDAKRTIASEASSAMQEPTLRRIEVLTHSPRRIHSSPSLDGKYMATTTRKAELMVSESATGKKWNLTEQGGVDGIGILPLISPDNTKIVYLWSTFETRTWEVRVVAFDGSDDRLLSSGWIDFDTWSPDGQFLFGRHVRQDKDNSTWLMKMSVDDGSMQYIDIVDAKGLSKVDVSSDGRFLAYHRLDKTTSNNDIFIFDLVENRESILVPDPADDKLLGWTPDGQHIFFTSDRIGTRDGWLLAVQKGKPKGLPRMIKPGLGDVVPIRMTRDGSLYYTVQYEAWNVYTVELDLAAGKATTEPKVVRDMGKDGSPDWSPDGRYLAYCSEPDQSKPQVIRIRTLATGEERELKPDLPHFEYIRWHPDSRHLLAPYLKSAGLAGVSQIDIQTGQCRDLLTAPVVGSERIREAEMSSDGKTLAYRVRKGNGNRLVVKDMETGREELLLSTEDAVQNRFHGGNSWALLPEGKQVALSFLDGTYQLKTMSVADKTTTTVVPSYSAHLTCINDGRDLLFVRGKDRKELWRVATTGSEPQKVWECEQLIINPRLHPDGRNLAFVSGTFISEMWLMENFLPEAAVAKPEPMTTVRRIECDWGTFASLSPDGKYLCDVDWDTENLAVLELATGKTRHLTGKSSDDACYPLESTISPDSRQIAYLWWHPNTKASSLHVVGLDGSGDRILCEGKYPMPRAWSADGKKILTVISENDVQQMVWISASDGSIKSIASFDGESLGYPGKFDISPDGRFIVYDRPQAENTSQRDIFMFDLIDSREFSIVEHPSDDKLLGWTPDGRHIFFASGRTGNWDAWLLKVADGKPQGFPKLTKQGIGDVRPIGFTPYGSYYYANERVLQDVFTARLDFETGAVLSEPMPVRQTGATACHDWSPDGRYLAYCERRRDKSQVIYIRTLATGREQTLADNLPDIRWLRWSLDGRSLLIDSTRRGDSQSVIFKIDVQTGKRTDLVRSEMEGLIRPEMSPDGKTLFFDRIEPKSNTMRLMARDLESGREKELFRAEPPARISGSALSTDGRQFVLSIIPSRSGPEGPVLKILSTAGGQPRELIQFKVSEKLRAVGVTWMPDSQNVIFWKWFEHFRDLELWRISVEGGDPQRLWSRKALGRMRIHPDGQRVAFYDRSTTRGLWVMENFLPEGFGK